MLLLLLSRLFQISMRFKRKALAEGSGEAEGVAQTLEGSFLTMAMVTVFLARHREHQTRPQ